MKTVSAALQAWLSTDPSPSQFFKAELFTFLLSNGTLLYYTSTDRNIVFDAGAVAGPFADPVFGTGPQTYLCSGPFVRRTNIRTSLGLSVDSMTVELQADPSHHVLGAPVLQTMQQGFFDGALVRVQRLYMPTFGDVSLGPVTIYVGQVADLSLTRTMASLTVNSLTELLSINMPRNLYQPGCRHTLFDSGCTLHAPDFQINGTIGSGSTRFVVSTNLTQPGPTPPPSAPVLSHTSPSTGVDLPTRTLYVIVTYVTGTGESAQSPEASVVLTTNWVLHVASPAASAGATGWNVYVGDSPGNEQRQMGTIPIGTAWDEPRAGFYGGGVNPPLISSGGYFTQGQIFFTSGANNGVRRYVQQYFAGGNVAVVPGLPSVPSAGDTFHIFPGCSKDMPTCENKYNNLIHFGGMPFVPAPEEGL